MTSRERPSFSSLPNEIHYQILSHLLPRFPITDSTYTRGSVDSGLLTTLCLVHRTWRELAQAYLYRQIRVHSVELPELIDILTLSTNRTLGVSIRSAYVIFNGDNDIEDTIGEKPPTKNFDRLSFEKDIPKRWTRIKVLWKFLALLSSSQSILLYLALGPQTIEDSDLQLVDSDIQQLLIMNTPQDFELPVLHNITEATMSLNMTGCSEMNIAIAPSVVNFILEKLGPCPTIRLPRIDERAASRKFRRDMFVQLCDSIVLLQPSIRHLEISFWPRQLLDSHRKHAQVYSHVQIGEDDVLCKALRSVSRQLISCKLINVRLSPEFFKNLRPGGVCGTEDDGQGSPQYSDDLQWPCLERFECKLDERDCFGDWWCRGNFEDIIDGDLKLVVMDPEGYDVKVLQGRLKLARNKPKKEKFDLLTIAAIEALLYQMPKMQQFHINYTDFHVYDIHCVIQDRPRSVTLRYFSPTEVTCNTPPTEVLEMCKRKWGYVLKLEPMTRFYLPLQTPVII